MTVPQFKAALHRARARFREILREEVEATVDGPGDGEREIGDLLRALS
jgi:RNA polymerase sigma-70 factor (ECF subfamily)